MRILGVSNAWDEGAALIVDGNVDVLVAGLCVVWPDSV